MTAQELTIEQDPPRVGLIGGGEQSAALLEVLAGRYPALPSHVHWFAVGPATPQPPQLRAAPTVEALFAASDLLIVDAPPTLVEPLLPLARLSVSDRHLLVLMGQGWSIDTVLAQLNERKLIRCLVAPAGKKSQPLVAYHATPFLRPEDAQRFRGHFAHLELVLELDSEARFEAVMGLVGFTPAAFYTMVDAMADGALMTGLTRPVALKCVAALLQGVAANLLQEGAHPALLREEAMQYTVAATGLMELESAGIRGLMMRALRKGFREIQPAKATTTAREEE